ncbi:hypothetical protein NM688_g521 [Phlebia brevispora]|uniref:Uncharacterized protein n=1 Tax=Phlebia brevispora TaxID=194682 RepID=A0ACC1TEX6_9APHY|nr:hypothetical protein NM688_g521 [Phlebia brevispora]
MALPSIFFVLSAEMLYMILAQFSTAQLLVFSHVSRQCRALTIRKWSYRFRILVAPFTGDMGLFEVMLDKYHVYVTGSIALAFMNWGDFPTTHSDLDLYVPTTWANAIMVHLVSEEQYRLVRTKPLPHDLFEYQTINLMEFKKGDLAIHVIPVSGSLFADAAIPSRIPQIDFRQEGRHQQAVPGPRRYTQSERDPLVEQTNPQVSCTGDLACPRFPRRMDDRYALHIPFVSLMEAYNRDEADEARRENIDAVAWMLGGADYVNGTNLSCAPYCVLCDRDDLHIWMLRHVSLRVVPRDPEDLIAMRRYLRTYANLPLSSVSAHTQSLEAFKDMKIRLSVHGRARIEPFKDVYEGFNRYGLHWEMPIVAPQSIQAGDLVVMECRMVRDDIPESNHKKWHTRLELMAVTLAVKYGHRTDDGNRSQDDSIMSLPFSEEV